MPEWIIQLGEALAPLVAVFAFLMKAIARNTSLIDQKHTIAMAAIEAAKTEASAALERERARTEQRHEYLRRDLSKQVEATGAHIDRVGETITASMDRLVARVDRMLEQQKT